MKKRKKIVSTLLIASSLANQPINVLAEELNETNVMNVAQTEELNETDITNVAQTEELKETNITNIAQTEVNSDTELKSNSLNEVYLDGSKSVSGSGKTKEDAVNNLQEALDLVADIGTIYVTGEVVIPDDIHMPNKIILIQQQDGENKGKLKFGKKLYLNNQLYVRNIEMEFSSNDKDCIFLNGNLFKINNTEIKGKPNVFIGSENKNLDQGITGYLDINNSKLSNNPIGNIHLGGKNGHTIEVASLNLKGINADGTISGENVSFQSVISIEDSLSINKIENIDKLYIYSDAVLDVEGGLKNIKELDCDNTLIRVKNGASIDAGYIYGSFMLDIKVSDDDNLIEGTYVKGKRIVGDVNLSDKLIRSGYAIKSINGQNSISFDVLSKASSNRPTNYAPVIKNLSEIRIKEGNTVNLKVGVQAWDFEDGDITKNIVFPDVDLRTLPIGRHEVTYKVTDSDNNTTTMNRVINVVPNEAPKINGIKDITIKVGDVDKFDLLDGITITDDRDDNLKATTSGKIEKPSPGTNKKSTITYTVTDSDGNTTTATRVITVTNQLPVISGANKIVIKKCQSVDLLSGVKASDEEDGDITKNIVITGTVDINKEDTYKLTYTVKDSDENITKIERLVVVEKGDEVVPPTEELESSLPPVIVEAIKNNLVNLNSGTGTVDNPFEIELKNISDDKVDSLLSDLNSLNTKINSLENKNGYTLINLTILKDSNAKTFKVSDSIELKEETHIVLKVKDEYSNIADKLRDFAKNNIEDSKDDNLNSDVNNNTNNNTNNNKDDNTDNNTNNNTNNSTNNNINKDDTIDNNNVNNGSTNFDNNKPTEDNPKTGDYVSLGMLSSLASLSLSGIILNTFGRKKNKK